MTTTICNAFPYLLSETILNFEATQDYLIIETEKATIKFLTNVRKYFVDVSTNNQKLLYKSELHIHCRKNSDCNNYVVKTGKILSFKISASEITFNCYIDKEYFLELFTLTYFIDKEDDFKEDVSIFDMLVEIEEKE